MSGNLTSNARVGEAAARKSEDQLRLEKFVADLNPMDMIIGADNEYARTRSASRSFSAVSAGRACSDAERRGLTKPKIADIVLISYGWIS
jgi:hypothetical protein